MEVHTRCMLIRKTKDMGLLNRGSIPLKVDPSQTGTSQQKPPPNNRQFSMSAKRLFSIVTGLTNIIECCFLRTFNLCVIFCIFIPFWPLLFLKMQQH